MITLNYTDFALALFLVLFGPIFMLWIHIKLEDNITHAMTRNVLTWIAPLTMYALPIWLAYYLFF